MTAIIDARNITKVFGRGRACIKALRSITLSLEPGILTLLMGPSGSGKTTLLYILGCMLTPDSGTLLVGGNSTEKASPEELAKMRRRWMGFVFQSYHLFPSLTAAENVQLALDIRGERGSKARAKSHDILATIGLAERIKSFPRELSGGEQQRVAIARAIASNPAVILADEPTGALDSENGRAIMSILAGIASERGSAVLVVTHDPRVLPFANRVICIEDGSIREQEQSEASVYPFRTGSRASA